MSGNLAFWMDLGGDLEDPEFAREHAEATALIQRLDQVARADQ